MFRALILLCGVALGLAMAVAIAKAPLLWVLGLALEALS